jgi:SepF-like predicted cell division protein (DUF552 family)
LQELKQNLLGKEDSITILIARITPTLSRNSDTVAKLVNELHNTIEIRKNYFLFLLGKGRLLITPNYAKHNRYQTGNSKRVIDKYFSPLCLSILLLIRLESQFYS